MGSNESQHPTSNLKKLYIFRKYNDLIISICFAEFIFFIFTKKAERSNKTKAFTKSSKNLHSQKILQFGLLQHSVVYSETKTKEQTTFPCWKRQREVILETKFLVLKSLSPKKKSPRCFLNYNQQKSHFYKVFFS